MLRPPENSNTKNICTDTLHVPQTLSPHQWAVHKWKLGSPHQSCRYIPVNFICAARTECEITQLHIIVRLNKVWMLMEVLSCVVEGTEKVGKKKREKETTENLFKRKTYLKEKRKSTCYHWESVEVDIFVPGFISIGIFLIFYPCKYSLYLYTKRIWIWKSLKLQQSNFLPAINKLYQQVWKENIYLEHVGSLFCAKLRMGTHKWRLGRLTGKYF